MTGEFVGRAAEMAVLRDWADEAAATGVGRFVLVTGDAGVGKTRLCAEFLRRLDPGVAIAWSRCWIGDGGPPLWPWPDLVAELAGHRGIPVESVHSGRYADRFGLFRNVVDQLRTVCAGGLAVALLDDLHAANHDVGLLTRFVSRCLHRFPLLLVATWRSEPAGPSSRLGALARGATSIEVGPFGDEEVSAYLRSLGCSDPDPAEVARLFAFTGGNPLYLAELVRYPTMGGGSGLVRTLNRRVTGLAPRHRRILTAAALLGDDASVGEVGQVLGCRAADIVEAVHGSASAAMVVNGRIRFSHDLLRDAFASDVAAPERRRLHLAAGRAIRGRGVDQVVRRAVHTVAAACGDAGERVPAVSACLEAAAELRRTLAFEQAAGWATRGAELAAGTAPEVETEAMLAQADAVLACGRLAEARELYRRAVEPAGFAGDPRLLARAALGLGGAWVDEQRDELSRRRMLALCRRALAALPADEELLAARLRVRLAAEQAYGGAPLADVAVAVDNVRSLGDPAATAEALSLYHHTLLLPSRSADRLAVADELLDTAAQTDGTIYALFGQCWRTVDLYLAGDGRADQAFVDLRERASALGCQSVGYIVAVLEVMRTFRRGDLAGAEKAAEEALRLGLAVGDADALAYYGAHLLAIRWVQGRLGELVEIIASVIDSATLRRRDRIYPALLAYGTALRSDRAAARAMLDALLADGLDAIPAFSTWNATVSVLVEAAAELGDSGLAGQLADRFAPFAHLPVMPSLAVVCLGPGERVVGAACAAAGRLDEAVTWFHRALRANRRLGNRPFDAVTRAQLAATLVRRGGPDDLEAAGELYAGAIDLGTELGLSERLAGWKAAAAALDGQGRPSRRPEPVRGVLERRRGSWYVAIDGRATTIDHLVGMRYVAELVARPDTDIAAVDLSAAVAGVPTAARSSRGERTLDDQALRAYRRRLDELDGELDAADLTGDAERARRAADERAFIVDTLRRDVGLGGRPRRLSDDAERSRMRVSKAIHRAIARLSGADPVLGHALHVRIRTGHSCRYASDPGQPIAWRVRT